MVFTKEDGILIKVLRQSKGYSARKLLEEFTDKDWSCSVLDRLLRQIDLYSYLSTQLTVKRGLMSLKFDSEWTWYLQCVQT